MKTAVDQHDDSAKLRTQLRQEERRADYLMQVVIPIGVALAYETDFNRLLERMLVDAMRLCKADGGTLYLRTEQPSDALRFVTMRTESLGLALGGTTGREIPYPPLLLSDPVSGRPNYDRVAVHAALTGKPVNVADVYRRGEFDFSGPKAFDQATGYRTRSLLAIPLADPQGRVSGVVQLINARDTDSGEVIAFHPRVQKVIECLCQLAAAALDSYVRQQALKDEVKQLRIEIDQTKRDLQVNEIEASDYFKVLKSRVKDLKERARGTATGSA
jgi:hypothetical protein